MPDGVALLLTGLVLAALPLAMGALRSLRLPGTLAAGATVLATVAAGPAAGVATCIVGVVALLRFLDAPAPASRREVVFLPA